MSKRSASDLLDAVADALERERREPDTLRREALLRTIRLTLRQWREGSISDADAIRCFRMPSPTDLEDTI